MVSKDNIRFTVQTPTADSFELSFKTTKTVKQLRDAIKQKHKSINPSFKIISDGKLIEEEEGCLYTPQQNQRYRHQGRRPASHQL
jgi:hypothetical protein